MLRRPLLCFALVLLAQVPTIASAADAAATVRGFYAPTVWNPLENDDFAAMTGPALALFEKSAKLSAASGEMGCIDFVVTTSGQDYDEEAVAKSIRTEETGTDGNGDTLVTARFRSFADGPDQSLVWTMHEVGGSWKVADIANAADGWKLSEFPCE